MFKQRQKLLFVLAFLALVLNISSISSQSIKAATSRPVLTFSNPSAQSSLGAAYNAALHNLLDINTIVYDPAVWNRTGLMTNPPGTFIRAGGGYPQPWARDAAVNSWNAGSLLEPEVAANTLWSEVLRQSDGMLVIDHTDQGASQWWDLVVWISAAWNHYLVTGDRTFLSNAYQAAINTLNWEKSTHYDATYGLYQGPSFFNDGIAGYPAPPADATDSLGPGALQYPANNTIMPLSTNLLYYQAYRSAAQMASALGQPSTQVDQLNSAAAALATAINQRLWNSGSGMYGYFIHGQDSLSGTLDPSEEGTGLSLAILFDIADAAKTTSILQKAHIQPYGIVDVYPNFPRYSDAKPGRHNNIVWPMIQGFWAHAAAKSGNEIVFAREVATLAKLANSTAGNFREIYNAQTGAVDGGWQTGFQWGSEPDQTWSATAYLRMIYNALFGMNFTTSGLQFQPFLPSGWGDVTLSGVVYRGMSLNISLHGAGNVISSFKLDGTTTTTYGVPTTLTGSHTIDITLTGSNILQAEQAVLGGGASINSDHAGFVGTGFVDAYQPVGASTTFTVNVPSSGSRSVSLRYANAMGSAQTVSLYVNGSKVRQISLPTLANWNVWSLDTETVTLNAGNNTIAFKHDTGDTGNVNLDALILNWMITPNSTNLALNKPTTASASCVSTEGPDKAVNGSITGGNTDKWCDNVSASKWMQVDLLANYNVNQFIIRHAGAGGENSPWNTNAYTIQLSTDNVNWSTVVTLTGNTASVTSHSIAAKSGRYVRLNISNAGADGAARIYEFEVYGSSSPIPTATNTSSVPTNTPVPATSTPPPNTNLALSKPSSANGQCATNETSAQAVDGSTTTKWCSGLTSGAAWLQVDLGANNTYSVNQFIVRHAGAGGEDTGFNTRDFKVQGSPDAATWVDLASVTNNTASITTHNISNVGFRYFRLWITNPQTSTSFVAARIYEFQVMGYKNP